MRLNCCTHPEDFGRIANPKDRYNVRIEDYFVCAFKHLNSPPKRVCKIQASFGSFSFWPEWLSWRGCLREIVGLWVLESEISFVIKQCQSFITRAAFDCQKRRRVLHRRSIQLTRQADALELEIFVFARRGTWGRRSAGLFLDHLERWSRVQQASDSFITRSHPGPIWISEPGPRQIACFRLRSSRLVQLALLPLLTIEKLRFYWHTCDTNVTCTKMLVGLFHESPRIVSK